MFKSVLYLSLFVVVCIIIRIRLFHTHFFEFWLFCVSILKNTWFDSKNTWFDTQNFWLFCVAIQVFWYRITYFLESNHVFLEIDTLFNQNLKRWRNNRIRTMIHTRYKRWQVYTFFNRLTHFIYTTIACWSNRLQIFLSIY